MQTRLVIIQLECCRTWTAVLIDQGTRSPYPTKVTATLEEGKETAIQKAMELASIDRSGEVPQFKIALANTARVNAGGPTFGLVPIDTCENYRY